MLPALANAQILNLSQNNLTEAVIDIFIKHRFGYLSGLKNLILSQNKIIERKHKAKIDQLRAMNIVVSVWGLKRISAKKLVVQNHGKDISMNPHW